MKKIANIALIIEFTLCFSFTALLWMTGCFFVLFWIPDLFSDFSDNLGGFLFLLWVVAGGIGLAGIINLLIHLLQPGSLQPHVAIYVAIVIGIIANLILNIIFGEMWHNIITQFTLSKFLVVFIFNAPIICALHFLWLSFRRHHNLAPQCWLKGCSLKPQQT